MPYEKVAWALPSPSKYNETNSNQTICPPISTMSTWISSSLNCIPLYSHTSSSKTTYPHTQIPPFNYADGRDFCSFVIDRWTTSETIFNMINSIPDKLVKIFNKDPNAEILGKFHMGMVFDLDIFTGIKGCSIHISRNT